MAAAPSPSSTGDLIPFDPLYLWAVIRNLASKGAGLLSVLLLTLMILRRPRILKQYKLSVVFLTYAGFGVTIPIIAFNLFILVALSWRPTPLRISILMCSIIKQFANVTWDAQPSVCCAIALVRFMTVIRVMDVKLRTLFAVNLALLSPLILFAAASLLAGEVTKNDECPLFISITWPGIQIIYNAFLFIQIVAALASNLSVLVFLRRTAPVAREPKGRAQRQQLRISTGLFVQATVETVFFLMNISFGILIHYGFDIPEWVLTMTNIFSSLPAFLNPLIAAMFIPRLRGELFSLLHLTKSPAATPTGMTLTTSARNPLSHTTAAHS